MRLVELGASAESDEELLRRVAAGDDQAFATFYERHAARVFGLLVRLLRNPVEAEDVLQEVFWQTWKKAGTYSVERGSAQVWLYLLARSRAIDLVRRARRVGPLPETWNSSTPPGSDPAAQFEREENARELRQLLDTLPLEQRALLRMAFFDGLTHEEIAASQGLPLGTVKTRIRTGMRRLREIVQ